MTIMYAEQPLHLVADDYDDNHTDTQPKYGRVAGEGRRSIAPPWNCFVAGSVDKQMGTEAPNFKSW